MIGSDYIRWAKSRERFRYAIGRSSIRPCPPDLLAARPEDWVFHGENAHGWLPLRAELGRRYDVDPDRIVLAIGTSMANHLACAALLRHGDDVLVEEPAYEPLVRLPEYLGCRVRRFERSASERYRVDPERIERSLRPETRLVILSDLHNPTGARAGDTEMDALAELADRHDFHVLVDEVYLEFVHVPGSTRIAARRHDRFVSTCSLTKAYGLDGLRAGWIVASAPVASRIRDLNDLFGIIMPHPSERLALRALERIDVLAADVAGLIRRNRTEVERFLATRPELSWVPPAAGPVGFVRLQGASVEALVETLEGQHDATLPPGRFFGAPDHFRIGFGMLAPDLDAGLERLGRALDTVLGTYR